MPMEKNPTTGIWEWVAEDEDFGPPPGFEIDRPDIFPDWREEITAPTEIPPLSFHPEPFDPAAEAEEPPAPPPTPEPTVPVEVGGPPPWEDFTIPYFGEDLDEPFELEKTELDEWLEETIRGRVTGEGIEKLTPEKIEEFRPYIEQIMKPRYEQQMRDLSERWRAAGRAIDTEKLGSVGRLSIQYNAEVVGKMIGLAKDEVDRVNFEMGRAIGQGLTLAQMDQADQHLEAGQKFQLNMYKRQIRDQAIQGLQNLKIKDYYVRLARAWDLEDWDAYRDLAEELAEAGQPDLADYVLGLIEAIAPAVILAGA